MRHRQSLKSATPVDGASILSRSRIRRSCTTWSCAHCAPATHGRCLPPVWYKSAPYRSRAVADPRGVLADFGVSLPKDTQIRIWDSTAEIRYLVVPMGPAGTKGWSEEKLAELVTRDSMIGTGLPKSPKDL